MQDLDQALRTRKLMRNKKYIGTKQAETKKQIVLGLLLLS